MKEENTISIVNQRELIEIAKKFRKIFNKRRV